MTSPQQRRDQAAQRIEVGAGAVAGGVGASLGATRLREAYRRENKTQFKTAASSVRRAGRSLAGSSGAKVARTLAHGEPGFVPLAVGTGAAATAGLAHKYGSLRQRRAKKKAREQGALTAHLTTTGAIGKGLLPARTPDDQLPRQFQRVDRADDAVRAARARLLPSSGDVAVLAVRHGARAARKAKGGAQIAVARAQDQLAKAERVEIGKGISPGQLRGMALAATRPGVENGTRAAGARTYSAMRLHAASQSDAVRQAVHTGGDTEALKYAGRKHRILARNIAESPRTVRARPLP